MPVSPALSVALPVANEVAAVPAPELPPSAIRLFLANRGSGRIADASVCRDHAGVCCSIFAIVIFIATILVLRSKLSLAQFGWKFFTSRRGTRSAGDFGALPFIFGTLATSFLALCMAVPLALAWRSS
jgi:phosphate transport system permease protein